MFCHRPGTYVPEATGGHNGTLAPAKYCGQVRSMLATGEQRREIRKQILQAGGRAAELLVQCENGLREIRDEDYPPGNRLDGARTLQALDYVAILTTGMATAVEGEKK